MAYIARSFNDLLTHTRGTGATRISPTTGFIVGVDFSTTSNTIGTGSKTFTLTADANVNREWSVGENVLVTAQAGATGTMTGVVTSYTSSTQALVINVPVGGTTGSGTSTDWRIGSLEVRRDANGLVVEAAAINSFAGSNSASVIGGSAALFAASPEGINNAPIFVPNTLTTNHRLDRSGVPTSAVFLSVYLKSFGIRHVSLTTTTGANTSFDLELARVNSGSGRIFPLKNGWCLCQITGGDGTIFSVVPTLDSQAVGSTASIGGFDGTQGLGFYGFTLRTDLIGVFTNESHIPTTTVSWTRNADTVTFNSTALQSVRQGQGVIYVDAVGEGAAVVASGSGGKRVEARLTGNKIAGQFNRIRPVLDLYPNAAAAYSTRLLNTAYTGAALRVRRSNDNAEADIGFSGGNLDEAALTAFVGANSAFVTTWYDQSGNARHATQTAQTIQPRIVNAGVVDKFGSRVSPFFDDIAVNWLRYRQVGLSIPQPISDFLVYRQTRNDNAIPFDSGTIVAPTSTDGVTVSTSDGGSLRIDSGAALVFGAARINQDTLVTGIYSGANSKIAVNGGAAITGNAGTNARPEGFIVGAVRGNNQNLSNFAFPGYIREVISYPSDQSANRAAIESNIMSYFGITG